MEGREIFERVQVHGCSVQEVGTVVCWGFTLSGVDWRLRYLAFCSGVDCLFYFLRDGAFPVVLVRFSSDFSLTYAIVNSARSC